MRSAHLVASVLVHLVIVVPAAIAVARATDHPDEPAPDAAARAAPIAVAWVEPPPVEVVLLDEPAAAPVVIARAEPTRPAATRAQPAAELTTGAATRGELAPARGDGTAAGRDLFSHMRGPTPQRESPGTSVLGSEAAVGLLEGIAADGAKPLPEPVHASGLLKDAPNGTARVDDLATTATVARDGTVTFADKPNVDIQFHVPMIPTPSGIVQGAQDAGKQLGKWYGDPYEQTRYGSAQDLPRHLQASDPTGPNPRCASWGDTSCDDANAPQFEKDQRGGKPGDLGLSGSFDLTAALMKKFHAGDPWEARKRKILAATFDERVEMGAKYSGAQLGHSAEAMQKNLEQLWAMTLSASARREALFAMWDECDEGEGARGEAGAQARLMVIGWIRARLPAGSPDAYTAAELAELSAKRTSHDPFAPYE